MRSTDETSSGEKGKKEVGFGTIVATWVLDLMGYASGRLHVPRTRHAAETRPSHSALQDTRTPTMVSMMGAARSRSTSQRGALSGEADLLSSSGDVARNGAFTRGTEMKLMSLDCCAHTVGVGPSAVLVQTRASSLRVTSSSARCAAAHLPAAELRLALRQGYQLPEGGCSLA